MNEKKKEEKNQELQKMPPRGVTSPFERFDLMSDSGLFKEMDRFLEEYLPRRWWRQFHLGFPGSLTGHQLAPFEGKTPSVDVIDRDNDFLIKAELPGVDKKDINISIANNVLTLEACMGKEEKEEKAEYYRQEICRGSYRRSIQLPAAVKEDDAKATFKNGILELTVPKLEKTKRSTIKVE
jgi:HSP20 family protein